MAVQINKHKYLRDIASLVQKGAFHFDSEDRPRLQMGGQTVFIKSVGYDMDGGGVAYTIAGADGKDILSEHGVRQLSNLDGATLKALDATVRRYADLRMQREQNLVNVESRVREAVRRPSPSLKPSL